MEQTNTPTGKNGVPSTIRRPSSTHDEDVLAECTKDAKTKQLFIFDPTMIWCFQRCSELQLAADFENTQKKKKERPFQRHYPLFFLGECLLSTAFASTFSEWLHTLPLGFQVAPTALASAQPSFLRVTGSLHLQCIFLQIRLKKKNIYIYILVMLLTLMFAASA